MFDRTRLALAALDDATYTADEYEAGFEAKQAALTDAIGRAFAEDTAAFNRPDLCLDLCRHSGGLGWVRDIVARREA
jgi:hypothetical protein